MATLAIRLLGGFELSVSGTRLSPIPLRAARSLLAFLVMHRQQTHTRDLLAGMFWPDLPDPQARRRLSQGLWQIRACLAGCSEEARPILTTGHDVVGFNPDADYWLDVQALSQLLARIASPSLEDSTMETELLEEALGLYQGDLLDGFYDDWLVPERDRLHELFLGMLERLTDLHMSRGAYDTAIIHARQLALHDPFRETAHQRVMSLSVLLGRHNDAIRQYELCERVLARELNARPSRVTRELYEATLLERESTHGGVGSRPRTHQFEIRGDGPFVGREQERYLALECLDAALAGRGSLLLVEGEAGTGKTQLLREVERDARWRGMDVLWGKPNRTANRPLAPLAEAVEAGLTPLRASQLSVRLGPVWRQQLARVAPRCSDATPDTAAVAAPLPPADEQARMREAISLAFESLSEVAPLLIVLDDMHWADTDTIQALAYLAPRTRNHPLVLALAFRQTEARDRAEIWSLVRSLDRDPSCSRVSLGSLTLPETTELARQSLGVAIVSTNLARRLHEETGGIPLLIMEALRVQHEHPDPVDRATEAIDAACAGSHATLTEEVYGLVEGRLANLGPDARSTIDLLSIHDGQLAVSEIIAASDLGEGATAQALDDLIRRRLVDAGAGGYRLDNKLLRKVIYSGLPDPVRTALHGRLASAIEAHRPHEVELLAHHFRAGQIPERAAHYLEQAAGRAIVVSAYDMAARHLEEAEDSLDQAAASSNDRFRVACRHEEVLDILARRTEQEQVLERMEQYASERQMSDVVRRRSRWLAHQDRFAEAETEARRAFDLACAVGEEGQAVAALSTLGMIACFAGRAADGIRHLERAVTLRGADLRQQADVRSALGHNLLDLQRFEEAEPQLLAALALYGELQDARGQAEVLGMLGALRMERGEPGLAESALQRAIDASTAIGYRHGEAVNQMNLGILYALTGRPRSAFVAFESAQQVCEATGNRRGAALVLSNAAWLRHAVIGDDAAAEADASEALRTYEEIGDARGQAQCLGTLGSIKCRSGHTDEGTALLKRAVDFARGACDAWIECQILTEWARCDLEAGQFARGLTHADAALRLCGDTDMKHLAISVESLRGRLLVGLGKPHEALAATGVAIRGLRPGAASAYFATYAHSLALAAAGQRAEAEEFLRIAHSHVLALLEGLPEDALDRARASVPSFREVITAWELRESRQIQYRLARIDAPTGRGLKPSEEVEVTWTLRTPEDEAVAGTPDRRRRRLIRLVSEAAEQGATPTVASLADALGASIATIRRDLATLRKQGLRVPTRGSRA